MIGQDRPRYDLLTFLKKFEPKNYFILYHWQREVEMCGSSVKATCLIPLRKHPKTFPWLPPPPWGFDHSSVRHNLWSHQLFVIEVIIRYQDAFTVQRQQTVHHQFLFFWTFQNYEHFYNSKGTFLLSLPKTFVEWWLSNF
jgi:hypothetical protein